MHNSVVYCTDVAQCNGGGMTVQALHYVVGAGYLSIIFGMSCLAK